MSDRILIWNNVGLIQFSLAKFLQDIHDCELFAVHDLNHHLKKSFLEQKIVNFKNEWYYWDHVLELEQKPDVEYLESFEQRYGIDLWSITSTDRVFNKDNKFYIFSRDEILKILELECKLFENVLESSTPDFLITGVTDQHRSNLLERMCRSKGITVLMLETSRLGYRSTISEEANEIDYFDSMKSNNEKITFSQLRENIKKFNRYEQVKTRGKGVSFSEKMKSSSYWMVNTFDKEYRMGYDHFGMSRFNVITDRLSSFLKRSYRESYIDKTFQRKIKDEKFVYFPLSVEPERTLSISAPFYMNQLEIVKHIAKSIPVVPVDFKLYVKEHYGMKYRFWRPISYYKQIMNLPNVVLIHPSLTNDELLKKCSIASTVTGTTGLEAGYYGKPSIIFGHTSYDSLSSVHKIDNLEELDSLLTRAFNSKKFKRKSSIKNAGCLER